MGALSDKVGRRFQLCVCAALALVTAGPLYLWLVSQPSFYKLLTVEIWFSTIFAGYNGAMVPFLTEIMPAHVRTTGFSFAYSLATGIFGGFTPAVSTALIRLTGSRAMPAAWLSAAAVMGLVSSALLSPRLRAHTLQSVADKGGGAVDPVHELPVR
jgi:MFS family permease